MIHQGLLAVKIHNQKEVSNMGKPEGIIEDFVINQCKERGYLTFKFTAPSTTGVPDRIVIGNGHTIFIELKAPGKKPSERQHLIMEDINNHDGSACWTDNKSGVSEILNIIAETDPSEKPIFPDKYMPCRTNTQLFRVE